MIEPNTINCCDVVDGLKQIENNSVHLIVTSPPFNLHIKYDTYDDDIPHEQYLKWMKEVWTECYRVLATGGRICINIDATNNTEKNGLPERVHPLHVDFTNQLRNIGYIYMAEIIWLKDEIPTGKSCFGSYLLPSSPYIRRNTEYIVVAAKETLKLAGDPMKSDLTQAEFHEWTISHWKIKPDTSTNKKGHPAAFPTQLPYRCIKLFSFVGNTVLDCFSGAGTTTTVAHELGRNYIGIDISPAYCEYARKRIRNNSFEYIYTPAPVILERRKKQKQSEKPIDLFK